MQFSAKILSIISVVILVKIFTEQELIDVEGDGLADMAFHCIQEMDIDNRMTVYKPYSSPSTI